MATYDIKDKVFLVTGGAGGIGAGFVRAIAEEAKHVAVFDVDSIAGAAIQTELNSKHGENRVTFYKVDVTNEDQINEAFDNVVTKFGNIDVLVNSAGLFNDSEKVFMKEININLGALVYLTMKFYTHARKDLVGRGGTVLNFASLAALLQIHYLPIYSATKSGVLRFSNCLGNEKTFSRTGVRVIVMCFGATDTTIFHESKMAMFDEEFDQELKESMSDDSIAMQTEESAVKGTLEVFKRGSSGSTWVAANNLPAADHSANVKKAFDILGAIIG